jgi:hypothetical protein
MSVPHPATLASALTSALLMTLLSLGCAPDGGPSTGSGEPWRLEVQGAATRTIGAGRERTIRLRLLGPRGGARASYVRFFLQGQAAGATLSSQGERTDEEGEVEVTVRAGGPGRFDLVAHGPQGTRAQVQLEVLAARFAELEYSVRYDGMRAIDWTEVGLFERTSCEQVRATLPEPTFADEGPLGRWMRIEEVEVGVPVAIYALGIDSRNAVAAEACVDTMIESTHAELDILLQDAQAQVAGSYVLDWTFDLTDAEDPSVDQTLKIVRGLGEDAANFLVTFVRDHPDTPRWLEQELATSAVRRRAVEALELALEAHHGRDRLGDFRRLSLDLDTAAGAVTVETLLSFSRADPEFGAEASHLLQRIRVPHGARERSRRLEGSASMFVLASERALSLPPHTMPLPLGKILEAVIDDLVLPTLPRAPNHLHALVDDVYACDALATHLSEEHYPARLAARACEYGRELLANDLNDASAAAWERDLVTVEGRADLADTDGDYDTNAVRDGGGELTYEGRGDDEIVLPVTLEGRRAGDNDGVEHPVRRQMPL